VRNGDGKGLAKYWVHFVYNKSYMDSPGFERGPSLRERPVSNRLRHGTACKGPGSELSDMALHVRDRPVN